MTSSSSASTNPRAIMKWDNLVQESEFLKDYFAFNAQVEEDFPILPGDFISPSKRINLDSKFLCSDPRYGYDIHWPPLDPRLNTTHGWEQLMFLKKYPEMLSEQIMFPGNVAVVQDPADSELSLYLCCWVGKTYDASTYSLSRYSCWGMHVNGRSSELWFPVTKMTELSPVIVPMGTPGPVPIIVGFASRVYMDCRDLMAFVEKQPARESGKLWPVTQKVVKLKGQTGSKQILLYIIHT